MVELTLVENPPQLIRTTETGQVNGFQSPVAQLQQNCELYRDWLHKRGVSIPVYSAVMLLMQSSALKQIIQKPPFCFLTLFHLLFDRFQTAPQSWTIVNLKR
ncbi:hypothetical protein [Sporosarcina sp. USHLN248]|uniref:hypothetical protein n=1 Tax=Sporosarcina sp. USHLN248 TaxID=3081300 RepID=UPI00301A7769